MTIKKHGPFDATNTENPDSGKDNKGRVLANL